MKFTEIAVSVALLATAQLTVAAPTPQNPWLSLAEGVMGGAAGGGPTTSTSGSGPAANGGISQSATSSSGGGGGLFGGLWGGRGGKSTTNNNANSGTLGQGAVSGVNGDNKQTGAVGSNVGVAAGAGSAGNTGPTTVGPGGKIGGAGQGAGAGMSDHSYFSLMNTRPLSSKKHYAGTDINFLNRCWTEWWQFGHHWLSSLYPSKSKVHDSAMNISAFMGVQVIGGIAFWCLELWRFWV